MKVALVRGKWHSVWESLACGYLHSYTKDLVPEGDYYFGDGYFDSDEEIIAKASECDIVGFSATTSQTPWSARIAREIRGRNPSVRLYLGGYGPSVEPLLHAESFDGMVIGEGERSWREILESGGVGFDGPIMRPAIPSLDSIPFPDREFIKVERCIQVAKREEGRRVTGILGNRGCLRRCKFCADGTPLTIYGTKLRERSPGNIVDEMALVRDAHGIEFFKFADPEVNTRPGRTRELCAELIRRGWGTPWGGNMLVNPFDGADARALFEAGCREVWFGLESGSPEILAHIGKGTNVGLTRKAFAAAKAAGLMRRSYVLIGTPPETYATIRATEDLIDEIQPDTVSFSVLAPYPGTTYYHPDYAEWDWERVDEYGGEANKWRSEVLTHAELVSEQLRLIEKYRGHLSSIVRKKIALGVINENEIALTDRQPDRCE